MGRAQERLLQMEKELFNTDEHHVLKEAELQKRIDNALQCGVVDRRTIYSDIQVLQQLAVETIRYSVKLTGYYMEHDANPLDYLLFGERIAQSRIIDEADVERINHLVEKHMYPDARNLLKGGYTVRMNRMSSQGDISHSIGILITAMEQKKRIRFQYEVMDEHFQFIAKHDGFHYDVSCYRFLVDGNAIYLYAGDARAQKKKTFRIDRMKGIEISEEAMEPVEKYYGEKSSEEICRQVNESAFHFDGELINLSLIVQYRSFIMDVLWELSKGTAKTVEDIEPGIIRVEFPIRKSQPLIRELVSYADLIRVDSPRDVAIEVRNLIYMAKCTYEV